MARYGLTANVGQRTEKGTKVTQRQAGAAEAEALDRVIIRENNTEAVINAIDGAIAAALEEIGLAAERFAKAETPVDTGRLRNSITHVLDMDEEAVYIGTNVEYAVYVHEPVRMRNGKTRQGVPFLRDAATQHVDRYRSILKKHLESA